MKGWLLFLFIPFVSTGQKIPVYKNLVFEGGGIRGIAYAGGIRALEEKGVLHQIERTAGSSVGAISALLVSLGYNAREIDSILNSLSLRSLNDGRWFFIGGQKRLRKNYGWYIGNVFENWISRIIQFKTGNANLTFRDLHDLASTGKPYKDFFCTGTNLTKQRTEIFSWLHSPDMKVRTAIRISISIPLYFGAVFVMRDGRIAKKVQKDENYDIYIDGGLLENFPIEIFDSCVYRSDNIFRCDTLLINRETLGLKLARPGQVSQYENNSKDPAAFEIKNLKNYISALYTLSFETINRKKNIETEKDRTVYISTSNISPRLRLRKITSKDKNTLIQNGYNSVLSFLQ